MTREPARLWRVNDVVAKIIVGLSDPVLGRLIAKRTLQLIDWANDRSVSVQDARRSTSGNIRFHVGDCDLFWICARAPGSNDLQEEVIWVLNMDLRMQVMHSLRDDIPGASSESGFQSNLSTVNPYLPMRLLDPDSPFNTFCSVYDSVITRLSP